MIRKPLEVRPEAGKDFERIVDHYLEVESDRVAERFIDALEATYASIATDPHIGSGRYGHQLGLKGLRFRILDGFPYLVFYVETDDQIEVWRVLHAHRDLPREIEEGPG